MKKMTAEGLENARIVAETNPGVPWTSRAVLNLLDHIVALEAEVAHAREGALEDVRSHLQSCLDESVTGTRSGLTQALASVEALKSKPAQETCAYLPCVLRNSSGMDGHDAACPTRETASEENGLLPPKRRREHEYGREHVGMFGSWVAYCVRPGCEAHRMKDRSRKNTCFYQCSHVPPTSEPGPCDVES